MEEPHQADDGLAELTEAQVGQLAAELRALREAIRQALDAGADGTRPVDLDQPIGRVSRIDAIQQQSMAKASRRNHERRLQQVVAALSAIDRGAYGACRRCEEAIGYARLKVRPETPLCRGCQGRAEQHTR